MGNWTSCKDRMPPNKLNEFCPKYLINTKCGVTIGWYNPNFNCWYVLMWFMTERFLQSEIDIKRGDVPRVVKVELPSEFVTHWMEIPKVPEEKEEDACE